MKKNKKQLLSGLAGTTMLLSGCAAAAPQVEEPVNAVVDEAVTPAPEKEELNGYVLTPVQRNEVEYHWVANVDGAFAFNQNVISPSDAAFNLYGTAMTGVCAKPDFAFEEGYDAGGTYYINVSGNMEKNYQVSLKDLQDKEETKVMSCACATGNQVINAEVGGIPLSEILQLAELKEGSNTITFRGSDGYGVPMPLTYALEKEAMLVYRVNGEDLPEYQANQMWMPGSVAKYFTRNVVDIEITAEEEVPAIVEAGDDYRVQVAIMNYANGTSFPVGQAIVFEGYADDYDKAISAVEFSLDNGETWTTYETESATADKWVYWYFTYTPEETGVYKMMVRAINEDGNVTPLASTLVFSVEEAEGI